ncbi:MAG: hypothetical protein ACE5IZ_07615 [Dehalococcoidia bacterium]
MTIVRMDEKGRIRIPREFRAALKEGKLRAKQATESALDRRLDARPDLTLLGHI